MSSSVSVSGAISSSVDDEELDAIDGSAAEGDDDIAPETDTDDDIAED
jgi:DNA gyrase subunit A